MKRALLWSRRDLAVSTLGIGLVAFVGAVPVLRAVARVRARRFAAEDRLAAACRGLQCPKAIGIACRHAADGVGSSPNELRRLILDDLAATGLDCGSISTMRYALRARSRQDFAAGRARSIDGWILSATEIRVYALASYLA